MFSWFLCAFRSGPGLLTKDRSLRSHGSAFDPLMSQGETVSSEEVALFQVAIGDVHLLNMSFILRP